MRKLLLLVAALALSVTSANAQPAGPAESGAAPGPAAPSAAATGQPSPPAGPANPHGAAPNPHGGGDPDAAGNPHGGGAQKSQGYRPPEDGARVDPALPKGTIALFVGDAFDQPVAEADVDLLIVHETVAQGKSTESKRGRTNSEGEVVFSGLPFGSGHSYAMRSVRGPASFEVGPVGLSDKGGVRAFLHVFDSTSDIDEAGILGRAEVQMSFKQDVVVVSYSITYFNRSPYAWIAEQEIILPEGFKALTTADGMSPAMIPTERGAILRGTLPPGDVPLGFRYHVPIETDGDQAIALPFLPNTVQVAVGLEASKKMTLTVAGFTPSTREQDPSGRSWLITQRQAKDRSDFINTAEVTITGLPTRSIGSWIAVAFALGAAILAALYVASRRDRDGLAADSLRDLAEAKQALLAEFVALERARQDGVVGPKTYERLRRSMLDALARIIDQLESGRAEPIAPSTISSAFSKIEDTDVEEVFANRKKPGQGGLR